MSNVRALQHPASDHPFKIKYFKASTGNGTTILSWPDFRSYLQNTDANYFSICFREFITFTFSPTAMPPGLFRHLFGYTSDGTPGDIPITDKITLSMIRSYFGGGPIISGCTTRKELLAALNEKTHDIIVEMRIIPAPLMTIKEARAKYPTSKFLKDMMGNDEYLCRAEGRNWVDPDEAPLEEGTKPRKKEKAEAAQKESDPATVADGAAVAAPVPQPAIRTTG